MSPEKRTYKSEEEDYLIRVNELRLVMEQLHGLDLHSVYRQHPDLLHLLANFEEQDIKNLALSEANVSKIKTDGQPRGFVLHEDFATVIPNRMQKFDQEIYKQKFMEYLELWAKARNILDISDINAKVN